MISTGSELIAVGTKLKKNKIIKLVLKTVDTFFNEQIEKFINTIFIK